jgi:2'-hydroxyisoflavone reductase
LLVVGGTGFLGRHLTEHALERGHLVTLLNRGETAPGLFPDVEHLRADRRSDDLSALQNRGFEAVVDTCGYLPDEVDRLVSAVTGAEHYTFVSSVSVYADPVAPGSDEAAQLADLGGHDPSVFAWERYGALKAACERATTAFAGPVLVVRPGLIAGPWDPTDRFTYWPRRMAEGGRVLAADPHQPVQVIDVRDLAAFLVHAAEAGLAGTFNAVGPEEPVTMAEVLVSCPGTSEVVWAGEEFLHEHGVEPWQELPLWVRRTDWGFDEIDASRAYAAGLCCRPLHETAADTLAWDRTRPSRERGGLLDRAREAELLTLLA